MPYTESLEGYPVPEQPLIGLEAAMFPTFSTTVPLVPQPVSMLPSSGLRATRANEQPVHEPCGPAYGKLSYPPTMTSGVKPEPEPWKTALASPPVQAPPKLTV